MRRRQFMALSAGAVVAGLSRHARGQQSAVPVIGLLGGLGGGSEPFIDGLRRGLKETGFVEGQNVRIDARWPDGHQSLKEVTAALVKKRVAVIFCGNNVGALEAKAATSEIPIVFVVGIDPVQM